MIIKGYLLLVFIFIHQILSTVGTFSTQPFSGLNPYFDEDIPVKSYKQFDITSSDDHIITAGYVSSSGKIFGTEVTKGFLLVSTVALDYSKPLNNENVIVRQITGCDRIDSETFPILVDHHSSSVFVSFGCVVSGNTNISLGNSKTHYVSGSSSKFTVVIVKYNENLSDPVVLKSFQVPNKSELADAVIKGTYYYIALNLGIQSGGLDIVIDGTTYEFKKNVGSMLLAFSQDGSLVWKDRFQQYNGDYDNYLSIRLKSIDVSTDDNTLVISATYSGKIAFYYNGSWKELSTNNTFNIMFLLNGKTGIITNYDKMKGIVSGWSAVQVDDNGRIYIAYIHKKNEEQDADYDLRFYCDEDIFLVTYFVNSTTNFKYWLLGRFRASDFIGVSDLSISIGTDGKRTITLSGQTADSDFSVEDPRQGVKTTFSFSSGSGHFVISFEEYWTNYGGYEEYYYSHEFPNIKFSTLNVYGIGGDETSSIMKITEMEGNTYLIGRTSSICKSSGKKACGTTCPQILPVVDTITWSNAMNTCHSNDLLYVDFKENEQDCINTFLNSYTDQKHTGIGIQRTCEVGQSCKDDWHFIETGEIVDWTLPWRNSEPNDYFFNPNNPDCVRENCVNWMYNSNGIDKVYNDVGEDYSNCQRALCGLRTIDDELTLSINVPGFTLKTTSVDEQDVLLMIGGPQPTATKVISEDIIGGKRLTFSSTSSNFYGCRFKYTYDDFVTYKWFSGSLDIMESTENKAMKIHCTLGELTGTEKAFNPSVQQLSEENSKPEIALSNSESTGCIGITFECPSGNGSIAIFGIDEDPVFGNSDNYVDSGSSFAFNIVDYAANHPNKETAEFRGVCVDKGYLRNISSSTIVKKIVNVKGAELKSEAVLGGFSVWFTCMMGLPRCSTDKGESPTVSSPECSENNVLEITQTTSILATCFGVVGGSDEGYTSSESQFTIEVPMPPSKASMKATLQVDPLLSDSATITIDCPNDTITRYIIDESEATFDCTNSLSYPTDGILLERDTYSSKTMSTTVHALCGLKGYSLPSSNDLNEYLTSITIFFTAEPNVEIASILNGKSVSSSCASSSIELSCDSSDTFPIDSNTNTMSVELLKGGNWDLNCSCINRDRSAYYFESKLVSNSISVPIAMELSTKPTFQIEKSITKAVLSVICPSSGEDWIVYCNVGTTLEFKDEHKCIENKVTVTEADFLPTELSVSVNAICVTKGAFTDFSNPSLAALETIHRTKKPNLVTEDVVGGIELNVTCPNPELYPKMAKTNDNNISFDDLVVNDDSETVTGIFLASSDSLYKFRCLEDGKIGSEAEFFSQSGLQPTRIDLEPSFIIKSVTDDSLEIEIECNVFEGTNGIAKYSYEKFTSFEGGSTFETPIPVERDDFPQKIVSIYAICGFSGYNIPNDVSTYLTTYVVTFANNPTFVIDDVLNGKMVTISCETDSTVKCDGISTLNEDGEETNVYETNLFSNSNDGDSKWSYECYCKDIEATNINYQFDSEIISNEITVLRSIKSDVSPVITGSVAFTEANLQIQCPEIDNGSSILRGIPYCSFKEHFEFSDEHICVDGELKIEESDFLDSQFVLTVRSACVLEGSFTDFDDEDMIKETKIMREQIPKIVEKPLFGGMELEVTCPDGDANPRMEVSHDISSIPVDVTIDSLEIMNIISLEDEINSFKFMCMVNEKIRSKSLSFDLNVPTMTPDNTTPKVIQSTNTVGGVSYKFDCDQSDNVLYITKYTIDGSDPSNGITVLKSTSLDFSPSNGESLTIKAICLRQGYFSLLTNAFSNTLIQAEQPTFQCGLNEDQYQLLPECGQQDNAVCIDESGDTKSCETSGSLEELTNQNVACVGYGTAISASVQSSCKASSIPSITLSSDVIVDTSQYAKVCDIICSVGTPTLLSSSTDLGGGIFGGFLSPLRLTNGNELSLLMDLSAGVTDVSAVIQCADDSNFHEKSFSFHIATPPTVISSPMDNEIFLYEIDDLIPTYLAPGLVLASASSTVESCLIENNSSTTNSSDTVLLNSTLESVITPNPLLEQSWIVTLKKIKESNDLTAAKHRDGINFSLICKDSYKLSVEIPLKLTIIDNAPPAIELESKPTAVTDSNNATFTFGITDGGIVCEEPYCSAVCVLDETIVYDPCEDPLVIDNLESGDHSLNITVTNNGLAQDLSVSEVWEWTIAEVYLETWIRKNGENAREFLIGEESLEINEFGTNMYDENLVNDENSEVENDNGILEIASKAIVEIGFTLSGAPSPGELVYVTCSVLPEESVAFVKDTIQVTSIDDISWIKFYGTADNDITDQPIDFSITCDVSSTIPAHYNSVDDIQFEGTKTNVVWPTFVDILIIKEDDDDISSVSSDGSFSFMTAGSDSIRIESDQSIAFFPGLEVTLNDEVLVPRNITPKSFVVELLPYISVCPTECNGDDAYAHLKIYNPTDIVSTSPHSFQVPDPDNAYYEDSSSSTSSSASSSSTSTSSSSTSSSNRTLITPMKTVTHSFENSHGGVIEFKKVFYTKLCSNFENGVMCLNAEYSHQNCGYGPGGLDCKECPQNSICPGGERLWPMPGFWVASEVGQDIVSCPEPAELRCLGWDTETSQPVCGDHFTGPMCGSCVMGYYPDTWNIECLECPKTSIWNVLQPLLFVALMGIVLFCMMFGLVFYTTKKYGGTLGGGAKRVVQFVIWTIMTVQTIIQVGRSAKSELPSQLQSIYELLNIFQFEVGMVHANCLGSDPFLNDKVQFFIVSTVVLAMVGVGTLLHLKASHVHLESNPSDINAFQKKWVGIQQKLFLAYGLLFPIICNEAFKFTDCSTINGKLYLTSNTVYECYGSDLFLLNMLGWIHIFVSLIGIPIFFWIYIQKNVLKSFKTIIPKNVTLNLAEGGGSSSNPMLNDPSQNPAVGVNTSKGTVTDIGVFSSQMVLDEDDKLNLLLINTNPSVISSWRYFLSNDYLANKFWFRLMNFIILLVLTFSMSYGIHPFFTGVISIAALSAFAFCFSHWPPYIRIESWKRPVKIGTLLLSIFASVLNVIIHADANEGVSTLNPLVQPLCWIMLFLSVFLLIALVVSFVRVLFEGANSERKEKEAKERKTRKFKKLQNSDDLFKFGSICNPMAIEMTPNSFLSRGESRRRLFDDAMAWQNQTHTPSPLTSSIHRKMFESDASEHSDGHSSNMRSDINPASNPSSPITPVSRKKSSQKMEDMVNPMERNPGTTSVSAAMHNRLPTRSAMKPIRKKAVDIQAHADSLRRVQTKAQSHRGTISTGLVVDMAKLRRGNRVKALANSFDAFAKVKKEQSTRNILR